MRINFLMCLLISIMFISCDSGTQSSIQESSNENRNTEKQTSHTFQNKGHELVYNMVQKVGNFNRLMDKKDVIYTYTYTTPNNESDISIEKYLFDGELSYGAYKKHERTLNQIEGAIEQGYDGTEMWLKNKGKILNDPASLKRVSFNRPTNFYWFTMMQKLLDPGLTYDHIKEETIDNVKYDVVKITFNAQEGKMTDIYQLYINKETSLVDQFLFTVADFGKMDNPNLMKLKYEEVDGMLLPTKRQYKKSTWNADESDEPWVIVNWTNISFNNGLEKVDFKKEAKNMTMKMGKKQSLRSKLEEKKANSDSKPESDKKRAYREGIKSVAQSGIVKNAKQVGESAPNFTLKNALGESVELNEYLKKGKVVLTWYRGGWCPYCNLTLNQLQEELSNFKENGANLIALTPELPDKSMSTAEKNDLQFEVLSDVGNKIAKEYGIVFKLTDDVAGYYNNAFDMNEYNGDKSNELPLAATYIIDEDGKILYSFLDADYRNRAEPSEITEFLKSRK